MRCSGVMSVLAVHAVWFFVVPPAHAVGNLMGHADRVHRWPDDDGARLARIGYGKCAIRYASILHGEAYRHCITVAVRRWRVEYSAAGQTKQSQVADGTHGFSPLSVITSSGGNSDIAHIVSASTISAGIQPLAM